MKVVFSYQINIIGNITNSLINNDHNVDDTIKPNSIFIQHTSQTYNLNYTHIYVINTPNSRHLDII